MDRLFLIGVFLCGVICVSVAQRDSPIHPQINILTSTPGVSMSTADRTAKIIIDFYMDLVCPDSADAFPILQEVVTVFPPEDVAVYMHQLPLPYHRNAFLLAQGYHQVLDKAPDNLQDYVAMCFRNISEFQGSTNRDKSEDETTQLLAELQETETGISASQFTEDLSSYGGYTVSTWKYGVRKGVAGTPWFFVNNIDLGVNPNDDVNIETWVRLINALLRFSSSSITNQSVDVNAVFHEFAQGEEDPHTSVQVATYLQRLLQDHQPMQNKQSVGNAHQQPMQAP